MTLPDKFIQILHDNFYFLAFPIRSKFNHDQSFCKIFLIGNMNLFAVVESALSATGGELLSKYGIEDNSNFCDLKNETKWNSEREIFRFLLTLLTNNAMEIAEWGKL